MLHRHLKLVPAAKWVFKRRTRFYYPYKGRTFDMEYFFRQGQKETILFIHGLGGAKENYWEACKSNALAEHTLICFDNPGTGNSTY